MIHIDRIVKQVSLLPFFFFYIYQQKVTIMNKSMLQIYPSLRYCEKSLNGCRRQRNNFFFFLFGLKLVSSILSKFGVPSKSIDL